MGPLEKLKLSSKSWGNRENKEWNCWKANELGSNYTVQLVIYNSYSKPSMLELDIKINDLWTCISHYISGITKLASYF